MATFSKRKSCRKNCLTGIGSPAFLQFLNKGEASGIPSARFSSSAGRGRVAQNRTFSEPNQVKPSKMRAIIVRRRLVKTKIETSYEHPQERIGPGEKAGRQNG
jgi:hypothetical protein